LTLIFKKHLRNAWPYALVVGVFLFLLSPILPTLGRGIWGPADPWVNGDFNGGWWLWWAASERLGGMDWTQAVGFPEGAVSLARVIPNPTDMFLLGLTGPPTPLKWNAVQLLHLIGTLCAGVALARAAGASRWAAAVALCLVAGSPVMLHEVAGGRPSNLIVWPGILALVALLKGRSKASGLWAALQAVLYLWHGVALVCVGLVLVKDWKVARKAALWGAAAVFPYLLWLLWGNSGLPNQAPPDGFTQLPLAGLWGLEAVPERFRLHALLLPLSFLALKGQRHWLIAGLVGLALALGPWPTWALGDPLGAGPMAWLAWGLPPLDRLHHPVRITAIALPVLAVAVALGLDAFSKGRWVGASVVVLVLLNPGPVRRATTYDQSPAIPFSHLEIPGEGPIVDVLGMTGRAALSLQTQHRRAIAEPLLFRRGAGAVGADLQALALGQSPSAGLWNRLRAQGFTTVLVMDRQGDSEAVLSRVQAALGAPLAPGVFSLGGGELRRP
jgi:hypothetical protein